MNVNVVRALEDFRDAAIELNKQLELHNESAVEEYPFKRDFAELVLEIIEWVHVNKREIGTVQYPVWKLDIIATDLVGISTDHRIIDNLALIKKMYSEKPLSPKEVITLASLYYGEFQRCQVYVTGGYNPHAIVSRFEHGRAALMKTIWERYVLPREDSICRAIQYRLHKGMPVPTEALQVTFY